MDDDNDIPVTAGDDDDVYTPLGKFHASAAIVYNADDSPVIAGDYDHNHTTTRDLHLFASFTEDNDDVPVTPEEVKYILPPSQKTMMMFP